MSSTTSAPLSHQQRESSELYHSDAYAWSLEQSDALRRRDFDAIDWENVIEEIESVGRTEKRIWTSKCANTITHLLKIEHARMATPEEVTGWEEEVQDFRTDMAGVIVDNPRLQNLYPEMFRAAWHQGRSKAVRDLASYDVQHNLEPDHRSARKTRDRTLPSSCPYRLHDVTAFTYDRKNALHEHDPEILPEAVRRSLDYHRSRAQQWDR
ncbi:MAG: DUF29 domain-containing protein [Bryobacterales bacterium]|nr:DUF29 domain-containing protein [Bryobacterales bacterium]MDE0296083.1 DUF29 domain-containing protein [Bryobacterales bacterium]